MSVPIPDRQALDAAFDARVGRLFDLYCDAMASAAAEHSDEKTREARVRYDVGYKIAWDAHSALGGT